MADFTTGQLIEAKLKADTIWKDNPSDQDIVISTESVRAIRENQTARLAEIQDPNKPNQLSVNWIDTSIIIDEACEDTCVITAPELDNTPKLYAIDLCREAKFSVNDEKLRHAIYSAEEVVARGQLAATARLDRYFNKMTVAKLKAFAGVNIFTGPANGSATTVTAGKTTIPSAAYGIKLMAYMVRVAAQNRMGSPFLIDDGELMDSYLNAGFDTNNLDGRGNAARIQALKLYFDLFGFADAAITEDTFAVARGGVAALTKNYHDARMVQRQGTLVTEFQVPSQNIPGVMYDATMTTTCVPGGPKGRNYTQAFEYRLHAGIFQGPTAALFPSVLAFEKGA